MVEISLSFGRFRRVAEAGRRSITIDVDGKPVEALVGDSLLVAVLANGRTVRVSEFGDGDRSGFCLMGACQDCWMWMVDGGRVRACTTPAREGMNVLTSPVKASWPIPA